MPIGMELALPPDMMNTDRNGSIENGAPWLHAHWRTCDGAWSYLPVISVHGFDIVLGKGPDWGAKDDAHGIATIHVAGEDPNEVEPQEFEFSWCRAGLLDVLATILGHEVLNHPAPLNVIAAAEDLWAALLMKESQS